MTVISVIDTYLFSNKGDVAIVQGTLNSLVSMNVRLPVITAFRPQRWREIEELENVRLCSNLSEPLLLMDLLRRRDLMRIIRNPYAVLDYVRQYTDCLRRLARSEVLWVCGGGSYGDVKSPRGLVFSGSRLASSLNAGALLGKPLIIGGISIGGDIYRSYTGYAITQLLRRSSYVLIRDPISYSIVTHYAKHVGSIKSIIKLGYDYAFNCVGKATRRAEKKIENLRNIAEVNEGKKIVFLNLMPHISKRIALSIVRQIVELGYCVLLYPHELDDFLWTRDLCSETNGLNGEIRSKTFVFDTMPYSSSELYYVLSRLNLHGDVALGVSCRSHGAIAFLTNLIPTAHLAYSHKGVGIMKMVGLGDYCTQTQQPNGHTLRTLISLLDKKSEEYRSFLRREIPIIRHRIMTQTRDAIDLVTQGA